MKLTQKDKEFLETLKGLMESKDLWVELKPEVPPYLVLRGTYGERIHQAFHMSRQGVRWRFHRLLNDVYVSAFETILFVEKTLGTSLRDDAIHISQQRYELVQRLRESGFQSANALDPRRPAPETQPAGRPVQK